MELMKIKSGSPVEKTISDKVTFEVKFNTEKLSVTKLVHSGGEISSKTKMTVSISSLGDSLKILNDIKDKEFNKYFNNFIIIMTSKTKTHSKNNFIQNWNSRCRFSASFSHVVCRTFIKL